MGRRRDEKGGKRETDEMVTVGGAEESGHPPVLTGMAAMVGRDGGERA